MIQYGKHDINQNDIDAVVDVLENHFLTQGEKVPLFEKALCDYTRASYCVAVNSGTSGLHIACLALGIAQGDCIWTTSNSFVASANCARYCGADVDFIDICPDTRNMCVDALEQKLLFAERTNSLPTALVVVHFAGLVCDMQRIHKLCKRFDIAIIEDAAHALGSSYQDERVGACEYSDMCVLSFHPVKSITTAEGGAVTTQSKALADKLALYAKHGITRDQNQMQLPLESQDQGPWYYQQLCLGYNYRLSDLHAALGISQLNRIDDFINIRNTQAQRYLDCFSDLSLHLPLMPEEGKSSWHLFMIELENHDRLQVYNHLLSEGIRANVHYIPIHRQPYYQSLGFEKGYAPNSERFYANALTLPLYVGLSEQAQDHVIKTVIDVVSKPTR